MADVRIDEALAWLESHVNLEAMEEGRYRAPTLDRITELCDLMGDPHRAYPTIHITGTNGKGSVARMVTELLVATGLSVGTYTSPDLEGINERLACNGLPVGTDTFAELLESLWLLEPMMSEAPTRFEILTAAAFRWFADSAVDAAVIEVGLGGRWDATNIVRSEVAVVTNVALDHTDILGPTRTDIATEKAGIVKPGSLLVLGEDDSELFPIFQDAVDRVGADLWVRNEHFGCQSNRMALDGRLVDLMVPGGHYEDLFIPFHGAHQGDNAAAALAAVDGFFAHPLAGELVEAAFSRTVIPGRLEVVSRSPLIVLDGAHNPAGAASAGAALEEEFDVPGGRVVVLGLLRGRDPVEILECLGIFGIHTVVACPAPSPRSMPAGYVEAAAHSLGLEATSVTSVADGVVRALELVPHDGMVVVTGSMYVAGAARTELTRTGLLDRYAR